LAGRFRLAVARLWHEGNSFNPVPVRLAQFQAREWTRGDAAVDLYKGTATEMAAVIDFLRSRPEWDGQFLRCTSAPPGGPVAQADLDPICEEILEDLAAGPWDGVYLSLHGALLGTGDLSPDYTLLRRVRAVLGPKVPVAVSFDMHACLNPAIGELVQVLTGYRTYPHVDMYETAQRALVLLEGCVHGVCTPHVSLHAVPMLPPSHFMRTDKGPMAELGALAAAEEQAAPGLLDATVFGGFAYADSPHAHATVSLCHEAGTDVSGAARRLSDAVLSRRQAFRADLPDAEAGLAKALDLLRRGTRWPIAILEPADNPLSGGLGDTTGLLRALIEAAPDLPSVFCFFHDPDLVARAHGLGEGTAITARIGGRIAPEFGQPIAFSGHVARLTDGQFTNAGPMERGMPVSLGRSAVLQQGQLKVVVTESCQGANDAAWCGLHGVDLERTALFCVKAKNHFRAAFSGLCGAIIDVDTPGPAPADLRLLPYRHVPRDYIHFEPAKAS
jgi:microcystin degradation protein MlrC